MAEKVLRTAGQFAQAVVRKLEEKNMTISFAESCTGGLLASTLVGVPGASHVFRESYVTYCDESKRDLLGVSQENLDKYTAVSQEVALDMAWGLSGLTRANLAVSVTGYADGENAGHIFVGICYDIGDTRDLYIYEYFLEGDRNRVRRAVVQRTFKEIWKLLQ